MAKIMAGERNKAEELVRRHFQARRAKIIAQCPTFESDLLTAARDAAIRTIGTAQLSAAKEKLEARKDAIRAEIDAIDAKIEKKVKRYKVKGRCRYHELDDAIEGLSEKLMPAVRLKTAAGRAIATLEARQEEFLAAILSVEDRAHLGSILSKLTK